MTQERLVLQSRGLPEPYDWDSGDSTMQLERPRVIFSQACTAVSRDMPVIRARHITVRP